MRDASILRNDQFNQSAKTALTTVASDFNDDIFCNEVFTNINFQPGEGLELFQRNWTLDEEGRRVWNTDSSKNVEFYLEDYDGNLLTYDNLKFKYPATVQVMMKINTVTDPSVKVGGSLEEYTNEDGDTKIDPQNFKSYVLAGQDPAQLLMFKGAYIDSTLRENLGLNGITLACYFAIFDTDGKPLGASSDELLENAELSDFELSTTLLPNNNFFEPYTLGITFPERSSYLLKRSLPFLIVSILIIIALILSFFSFLRFLMKQVQLNQMKSNFVNNMTHEFKTPTANISLAMENIDMLNGNVGPRFKKYLRIIDEENTRMITNVERILEVTKYSDPREGKMRREQFDLNFVFKEINERFPLRIEKAQGEFTCKLKAQKTIIDGDRHHFKNAITNVLDNALKYCKDQPKVHVTTRDRDGMLEIEIVDQGIGIDQKDHKRIFEPFFRQDTGDVHNVKGFGLGLSYVKRVMEMHNGEVLVDSTLGEGTTFILRVPVLIHELN